jgi:hypothetical protein
LNVGTRINFKHEDLKMKLRLFVLVLLVANALALVWHLGWLDGIVGVEARTDREPQRVLQQVNPQSVAVVSLAAAGKGAATNKPNPTAPAPTVPPAPALSPTNAPASPATSPSGQVTPGAPLAGVAAAANAASCVEVGPLTSAQLVVAEQAVAELPGDAWRRVSREKPASWAVVMGPFPTFNALITKSQELEKLKQKFERVPQPNADGSIPAKAPSLLLLQKVASREAGTVVLAGMAQRGIRTARVFQMSPAMVTHSLRVEGASNDQIMTLKANGSGVEGKPFTACQAGVS